MSLGWMHSGTTNDIFYNEVYSGTGPFLQTIFVPSTAASNPQPTNHAVLPDSPTVILHCCSVSLICNVGFFTHLMEVGS
jgi:hypothetical protein